MDGNIEILRPKSTAQGHLASYGTEIQTHVGETPDTEI